MKQPIFGSASFDSLQYHVFCAEAFFSIRLQRTPSVEHSSVWLHDGATRELSFAYVASEPGEDPAVLVRAWRGDVANELERTVASWLAGVGNGSSAIESYRRHVASGT